MHEQWVDFILREQFVAPALADVDHGRVRRNQREISSLTSAS